MTQTTSLVSHDDLAEEQELFTFVDGCLLFIEGKFYLVQDLIFNYPDKKIVTNR